MFVSSRCEREHPKVVATVDANVQTICTDTDSVSQVRQLVVSFAVEIQQMPLF